MTCAKMDATHPIADAMASRPCCILSHMMAWSTRVGATSSSPIGSSACDFDETATWVEQEDDAKIEAKKEIEVCF